MAAIMAGAPGKGLLTHYASGAAKVSGALP